ncbi:hypothetical protein EJB05_21539 [Eragrostis curvula]|uniref:Uncharacterized protein n=1 Tax=Eragrostis curvula TaxID=38414 RepID=A0A5J9V1R5_9POAL|nr:hypothetical protein EJB05_21539 [Eragrostis curvula]
MAECSLVTLRGQYHGRWTQSNSRLSSRNMQIGMLKRNHAHKFHLPCHSSVARVWKNGAFTPGFHGRGHRVKTLVKGSFLEPLIDSESIVSPNLVLVLDEALLSISIVFAYLAGVVPSGQTFPRARNQSAKQHPTPPSSSDAGRDKKSLHEKNTGFNPSDAWSDVRNISESSELADGTRWLQVSTMLIDGLIQPAFMKWIEEEEALENGKINEKLLKMISSKIKEEDRVLKNFNRIGKSELYLDLLFFLRFGSARPDSYFDAKFLAEHGARILEDLVISLADVIAGIYLELVSVDGDMSTEVVRSSLALCSLSTRELQKLRNEVAINLWLHQYFESIVAMYEDRFELYVLSRKRCEKPAEKTNWWRLALGKPDVPIDVNYVNISPFSLPARRTKELRALTAWRYYFSLFLELSDIAMPFLRAAVSKISAAVSYFWVSMIGRSLGLIFSGIRQSLGWR